MPFPYTFPFSFDHTVGGWSVYSSDTRDKVIKDSTNEAYGKDWLKNTQSAKSIVERMKR